MRTAPACSTSRTWARSRPRARTPQRSSSACSPTTCAGSRGRRPVRAAVPRGRWRARRPLHLPPRRPLPDGHERRQPREGPRLARAARRRLRRRRGRPLRPTTRCSPCRGPGPRARRRPHRRRRCRARMPRASARWRAWRCSCAAPATPARTGSSCCSPRTAPGGLGRARWRAGASPGRPRRARHAAARGLLPPLRQRPERGPRADRGRARAGAASEATGFIGSDAVARGAQHGTAEKLVPFAFDGPGIPRQGNPVVGGGEVTSGTFSPCLENGIGMAYVPAASADAGHADRDRRSRHGRAGRGREKPLYRKGA